MSPSQRGRHVRNACRAAPRPRGPGGWALAQEWPYVGKSGRRSYVVRCGTSLRTLSTNYAYAIEDLHRNRKASEPYQSAAQAAPKRCRDTRIVLSDMSSMSS
jgi:hypothetical protein